MSFPHDDQPYLSAPSPNPSNTGSNETFIDPSPVAPSSNGTDFTDLEEIAEPQLGSTGGARRIFRSSNLASQQPELKVGK
jgi:hypothetical protein